MGDHMERDQQEKLGFCAAAVEASADPWELRAGPPARLS